MKIKEIKMRLTFIYKNIPKALFFTIILKPDIFISITSMHIHIFMHDFIDMC